MAVTVASLLKAHGGLVNPELFEDEDNDALEARLLAYITEGAAEAALVLTDAATIDKATKAWATHRWALQAFVDLSGTYASVQFKDQGSGSMLVTQIQNFKDLADAQLLAYTELLDSEADTPSAVSGFKTLTSLRHA